MRKQSISKKFCYFKNNTHGYEFTILTDANGENEITSKYNFHIRKVGPTEQINWADFDLPEVGKTSNDKLFLDALKCIYAVYIADANIVDGWWLYILNDVLCSFVTGDTTINNLTSEMVSSDMRMYASEISYRIETFIDAMELGVKENIEKNFENYNLDEEYDETDFDKLCSRAIKKLSLTNMLWF